MFDHVLVSDAAGDTLIGGASNDALYGQGGDDHLIGNAGNDIINGGPGIDTAAFSGNHSDYAINYSASTQAFTIADQGAGTPDGTDTVSQVEQFQFADGTYTPQTLIDAANTTPWA